MVSLPPQKEQLFLGSGAGPGRRLSPAVTPPGQGEARASTDMSVL